MRKPRHVSALALLPATPAAGISQVTSAGDEGARSTAAPASTGTRGIEWP
ncbi:hypothetical protein ACGH2B_04835 [Streptomyces sp. BBFR2]